MPRRRLATAMAAACVGLLTACGAGATDSGAGGPLEVVAAFYPLQYAVQQVGGQHVEVTGLTKPGAAPHDVELTAKQVASVSRADVVVYLKGFQSAVDSAVASQAEGTGFDVTPKARLDLAAVPHGHEGESTEEHSEHSHEGNDPHFWLDPERYADVAGAIATELGTADPDNAIAYTANARALRARLAELDTEFSQALASCASEDLVTSHAAFGYLAEAYGLRQESITGLTPESEPDPAALARITGHVREHGVKTIYAETLVSREVAETISRETGARLALLDPLEGLTDASAGRDYFEVMRANLAALRTGQGCR